MADTTRLNFMIPIPLKEHLDKIAKQQSEEEDRNVSVGELLRKAVINTYGKPIKRSKDKEKKWKKSK